MSKRVFETASRWAGRLLVPATAAAALFSVVDAQAAPEAELRCTTKYFLFGHLRGKEDKGDCTSTGDLAGPNFESVELERDVGLPKPKQVNDDFAVVDAKLIPQKDGVFDTTLRARPKTRQTSTAVANSLLKPGGVNLAVQGYIGEVDKDSKSECVHSRFLKFECTIVKK